MSAISLAPPPPRATSSRVGATVLPAGMRDLLPEEAAAHRAVARAFLDRAALLGYDEVTLPVFEYAATIERGLGTLDPREMVRFVEPETGEVVALRPDVTPQIARLVATRLADRPTPHRLSYDASVVRRRSGSRARTHRQIAQVGVEHLGAAHPAADLEVILLAATSLAAMGLPRVTIDLGHAGIAHALLPLADSADPASLVDALSSKDVARVERETHHLPAHVREAFAVLPTLHGAPSILDALPASIAGGPARPAIDALRDLVAALAAALRDESIADRVALSVDLGELRGHAYYSGVFFQVLAEGPGAPIAGGGRYDGLLARFGRPLAATGVALDVDALLWSLRLADSPLIRPRMRVAVLDAAAADAFAHTLRNTGIAAVVIPAASADSYARAYPQSMIIDPSNTTPDAIIARFQTANR